MAGFSVRFFLHKGYNSGKDGHGGGLSVKKRNWWFVLSLLIALLVLIFFSDRLIDQSQSEGQLAQLEDQLQVEAEPAQVEEAAPVQSMAFDDWLAEADLQHEDLVLEDLGQMSVFDIVSYHQKDLAVADEQFALSYQSLQADTHYGHRQGEFTIAASTTKIILAMLYFNLIDQDILDMDSAISYQPPSFQDGRGMITAQVRSGGGQAHYRLDYVLRQMIVESDNTATLMLRHHYRQHYGNLEQAFQDLLGLDESQYPQDLILHNYCTTHILQIALNDCLLDDIYEPLLSLLKNSNQPIYLSAYLTTPMHAKYGQIYDGQHDAGIFFWQDQPQYILVVMTQGLTNDQANQFIGGINFQLAVKYAYEDYLDRL